MGTAIVATPFEGETIVVENLTFEEFLREFDGKHAEWYQGKVILVMANNRQNQAILSFLNALFALYFGFKPIGEFILAAFSMVVSDDLPHREPDLIIVMNENRQRIKESYLDGAADIAIEIVSPESVARDYGKKFQEYELAGVREYWIIDPMRQIADVYLLGEDSHYHRLALNSQEQLVSSLLQNFALDPAILWREELPKGDELIQLVNRMLDRK